MKSLSERRLCCWIVVVGIALCASASGRDMVNLLPNPGFESGMPGKLAVTVPEKDVVALHYR